MEEVPKYEQLFVLMNANARTGRREKGQVGSKDSKFSVPTAEIPSTTTENYCCPLLTTVAAGGGVSTTVSWTFPGKPSHTLCRS